MSRPVVVLANPVVDVSFPVERFPILPGEHQVADERLITAGGQATTLFCGARLGLDMQALGTAGNDDMGRLWLEQAGAEGIDASLVILRADRPTSASVVLVDPAGQHVFIGAAGGDNSGPVVLPDSWLAAISSSSALVLTGWSFRAMGPEPGRQAVAAARAAGVPVFFDPGPEIGLAERGWTETMVGGAAVVLLTYEEAQMIAGEPLAPRAMAASIRQLGAELVLLKLGADGVLAQMGGETVLQLGFPVTVRDTTGAGDSVVAAAVWAYLRGYSLEKMTMLLNATGAACVQKFGAGVNAPYPQEIQAIFATTGRSEVHLD